MCISGEKCFFYFKVKYIVVFVLVFSAVVLIVVLSAVIRCYQL